MIDVIDSFSAFAPNGWSQENGVRRADVCLTPDNIKSLIVDNARIDNAKVSQLRMKFRNMDETVSKEIRVRQDGIVLDGDSDNRLKAIRDENITVWVTLVVSDIPIKEQLDLPSVDDIDTNLYPDHVVSLRDKAEYLFTCGNTLPFVGKLVFSNDHFDQYMVDITPEMAKFMLGFNHPMNRRQNKKSGVDRYTKAMKEGKWDVFCATPMNFDKHGRGVNYQHRAEAIVASGVTWKDAELRFSKLHHGVMDSPHDIGLTRTRRDNERASGLKLNQGLSAGLLYEHLLSQDDSISTFEETWAAKIGKTKNNPDGHYRQVTRRGYRTKPSDLSPVDEAIIIRDHPYRTHIEKMCKVATKKPRQGVITGVAHILRNVNASNPSLFSYAVSFCTQVISGRETFKGTEEKNLVWLQRYIRESFGAHKSDQDPRECWYTIKAWNNHVTGQQLTSAAYPRQAAKPVEAKEKELGRQLTAQELRELKPVFNMQVKHIDMTVVTTAVKLWEEIVRE